MAGLEDESAALKVTAYKIAEKANVLKAQIKAQKTRAGRLPGLPCGVTG
jgi:hypothetical protein